MTEGTIVTPAPALPGTLAEQAAARPLIGPAIIQVQRLMAPLAKDGWNSIQKFKFRGIDQLYDMIHPILAEVGIVTLPDVAALTSDVRTNKNGIVQNYVCVTMRYTFMAEDGSSVSCTTVGEALDSGDKAANKAMANAHKYALFQAFTIPTGEEESDAQNNEAMPSQQARAPRNDRAANVSKERTTKGRRPADEETPWTNGPADPADTTGPTIYLKDGTSWEMLQQKVKMVAPTPDGKEILRNWYTEVSKRVQGNLLAPALGAAALTLIKERADSIPDPKDTAKGDEAPGPAGEEQ